MSYIGPLSYVLSTHPLTSTPSLKALLPCHSNHVILREATYHAACPSPGWPINAALLQLLYLVQRRHVTQAWPITVFIWDFLFRGTGKMLLNEQRDFKTVWNYVYCYMEKEEENPL